MRWLENATCASGGKGGLLRLNTTTTSPIATNRFVLDVGQAAASLIKNFGSSDEDVELGLKIIEHLMSFIIRLMVHATENYAKLRLSLTEQSPIVVPLAILPFVEIVLNTPAGLLGPVFYRRLLFAIQSLAILTYKVNTVRGIVGEVHEENMRKIVRLIGGGRFWKVREEGGKEGGKEGGGEVLSCFF